MALGQPRQEPRHDFVRHPRRGPHAHREVRRRVQGPPGCEAGGQRHPGSPGQGRCATRPGRLRDHGTGDPGRGRPDHRPSSGHPGGHPSRDPRHHHQQGLPLRPERHRPRRSAHPCRRGRGGGGRRDGVHVAGAVPPPRRALGSAHGQHRDRRFDDLRRTVVHLHRQAHGRLLRRRQHRAPHRSRRAGCVVGPVTPAGA